MARNLLALLPLVRELGTEPDRLLHRRPRPGGHRRRRPRQRDGAEGGRGGHRARGRARHRVASTRRSGTGSRRHGAIAPGYQADLLVLPDLERFVPELVLKRGRPVEEIAAARGPRLGAPDRADPAGLARRLRDPLGRRRASRAIGLVPDQVVTESLVREPTVESTARRSPIRSATSRRSRSSSGTSRPGGSASASSRGSGLARGALASSVAHDAHNLVVVGMSDDDMAFAVARLAELGGGIVAVESGARPRRVPAPDRRAPLRRAARGGHRAEPRVQRRRARARLDRRDAVPDAVVPRASRSSRSLKITDRGLVDVDRFEIVPLEA